MSKKPRAADPNLKSYRAHCGADRCRATVQACGGWRGTGPIARPTGRELFTTTFCA